jgi:hypothetical protein
MIIHKEEQKYMATLDEAITMMDKGMDPDQIWCIKKYYKN